MKWLWSLMPWFVLRFAIVDDSGGGGDDDDFTIEEEEPSVTKEDTDPKKDKKKRGKKDKKSRADKTIEQTQSDDPDDRDDLLDEVRKMREERQIKEAIEGWVNHIKQDIPDFDIDKVADTLREMAKEDEAKAARYNNPAGWVIVWNTHHAKATDRDGNDDGEFDPGRNNGEEDVDIKELYKAMRNGDKKARRKLMAIAK